MSRGSAGGLGPLLVFTDRAQAGRPLEDVVRAAVDGGARTVVLREKDLPSPARAALAARLRPVLAAAGGRLVVAGPDPLGGSAVHLAATDPAPPRSTARLVGRSCHDATELPRTSGDGTSGDGTSGDGTTGDGTTGDGTSGDGTTGDGAAGDGAACDYVTVSPVFPTASKPGYGPPLGLAGLRRLAAVAPCPVYALGGVTTPDQVAGCRLAGAAGVAVMGAVMRAPDPAALVRALLSAAVAGAGAP